MIGSPGPTLSRRQDAPLRRDAAIPILAGAGRAGDDFMVQTSNRFFDEVARLMNDAAGVASGVRREFDTLVRTQAERILRDLDVVKREEFEAVKEMAQLAREENEALKARIAALEAKGAGGPGPSANQPTIV
jgi:BMFP domain-containing protein YqiC